MGSRDEVTNERGDFFRAIPERWDFEVNHAQTIQQVFSKLPRSNEIRQISIRCCDHADVDRRQPPV